jgi:pimeloyl-ACP methyl ester carboxylesterase
VPLRLRAGAFLTLLVVVALWPAPARAQSQTIYFEHRDRTFLHRYQKAGGAALLPPGASAQQRLPLVVFLHGTNASAELHLWMGGGGKDLRPLARRLVAEGEVRPFVLAAPSQTKNAGLASKVWQGFELRRFVDDVVKATAGKVGIDRSRVVLVGHSGAGCNPSGGLAADFASEGGTLPLALVSIDPCMDRTLGDAFARRPAELPLLLWWQPAIWVRKPEAFSRALAENRPRARVDRLVKLPPRGQNPHEAILPTALERSLRELLGAEPPEQAVTSLP